MRLIDADSLINIIKDARRKSRTLTGFDMVWATEKQPTIEAIPVKWLENKREDEMIELMLNIYGRGDEELVHAIKKVLEAWRKDQGENDG